MSDRDHARMILTAARRDLLALSGMSDRRQFADEIFGFHAQQAVEKALKAWLSLRRLEYPRTHDLEVLFDLLVENGERLPQDLQIPFDLTDFAVQFRYEAYDDLTSELDRVQVAGWVTELVDYVSSLLES
jgi:HEPN domain-containing protein